MSLFYYPLKEWDETQRHTFKEAVDLRLMEHGILVGPGMAGTVVAETDHIKALLGVDWRRRIDSEISVRAQSIWREGEDV